jgi:hypothetical protein
MVSHILYNIKPKMYETVITVIKRELGQTTTAPTMTDLNSLKHYTCQIYGQRHTTRSDDKHERVLAAQEGKRPRKFKNFLKGDCRICGKKGHKAIDCWKHPSNKDKKHHEAASVVTDKKLTCTYCKKNSHTVDRCWEKEKDTKKSTTEAAEVVMVTIETNLEIGLMNSEKCMSKNLFITDSGATSHMINTLEGMYDLEDWIVGVKVGNSEIIKSKKKGKFKGIVNQADGSTLEVIIIDVLYVPDLWINLLSLVKVISNPNNTLTSNLKGEFLLHLG